MSYGTGSVHPFSKPTYGKFNQYIAQASGSDQDVVEAIDVSEYRWLSLQITGSFVGTITFQGSNENITWVSHSLMNTVSTASAPTTSATANAIFAGPIQSRYFRARMTSYTSGTGSGILELYNTATAPLVVGAVGTVSVTTLLGGTIGLSGSSYTFSTTGSTNATVVGGTVGLSGSSYTVSVTGSQTVSGGTIGLSGSSYTLATTGSTTATVAGGTIGLSGSSYTVSVTGSMSAVRITGSLATNLYASNNSNITAGGGKTSGNLDVSGYSTKSIYGYLYPETSCSGSLVVSGSFDGTNYYSFRDSGVFNSGSLMWFTIVDALPNLSANLYNSVTGSAVSGSLFVVGQG